MSTGAWSAPVVIFAGVSEASAMLGWEDDYVRATRPLERRLLARRDGPVDAAEFRRYMEAQALEWSDQERRRLEPFRERLEELAGKLRARVPARILLIKADDVLDGAPHSRINAIILPRKFLAAASEEVLSFVLAHELFHLVSRHDEKARERLYAAIGFQACDLTGLPEPVERLRITNPDAPRDRHAIRVRHAGQALEVVPVSLLPPGGAIDPAKGFLGSLRTPWFVVERKDGACRASGRSLETNELQGLYEQIGRNTEYILHPEEILADNFGALALSSTGRVLSLPSPHVVERMRAVLF